RVGEQIAVVWNCVYLSPPSASRCIVGVSIGPPNGDSAPNPVSSHKMNRTFGAPAGAFGCSYGSQSGVEWRTSTLIVPLNGLLIVPPHDRPFLAWRPVRRPGPARRCQATPRTAAAIP